MAMSALAPTRAARTQITGWSARMWLGLAFVLGFWSGGVIAVRAVVPVAPGGLSPGTADLLLASAVALAVGTAIALAGGLAVLVRRRTGVHVRSARWPS